MRLHVWSVCLVFGIGMLGCGGNDGPELVNATGTVLYKGQPVAGATVTFLVPKNPLATGTTDADGKFTLSTGGRPGVVLGTAMVGIVKFTTDTQDKTAMKPSDMAKMAQQSMDKGGGTKAPAKPKSEIPEKYANPESSTLVAPIVADAAKNDFRYELVD